MDLKIWEMFWKGPINLFEALWTCVTILIFVLSRAVIFVAQSHRKKKIWLHLPQFMKPWVTQTWLITFAGGNKSNGCSGNKCGTHMVLNLAVEIRWHLRGKRSYNLCTEGHGCSSSALELLFTSVDKQCAIYWKSTFKKPQTLTLWGNRVENVPVL